MQIAIMLALALDCVLGKISVAVTMVLPVHLVKFLGTTTTRICVVTTAVSGKVFVCQLQLLEMRGTGAANVNLVTMDSIALYLIVKIIATTMANAWMLIPAAAILATLASFVKMIVDAKDTGLASLHHLLKLPLVYVMLVGNGLRLIFHACLIVHLLLLSQTRQLPLA
jgi:hypothetical protein